MQATVSTRTLTTAFTFPPWSGCALVRAPGTLPASDPDYLHSEQKGNYQT